MPTPPRQNIHLFKHYQHQHQSQYRLQRQRHLPPRVQTPPGHSRRHLCSPRIHMLRLVRRPPRTPAPAFTISHPAACIRHDHHVTRYVVRGRFCRSLLRVCHDGRHSHAVSGWCTNSSRVGRYQPGFGIWMGIYFLCGRYVVFDLCACHSVQVHACLSCPMCIVDVSAYRRICLRRTIGGIRWPHINHCIQHRTLY